ncbi:hypothetical protein [Lysobacter gummosus]
MGETSRAARGLLAAGSRFAAHPAAPAIRVRATVIADALGPAAAPA